MARLPAAGRAATAARCGQGQRGGKAKPLEDKSCFGVLLFCGKKMLLTKDFSDDCIRGVL